LTRISVALATHNGERFLREQLDSLARQTLTPSELVVQDDWSTDGTLAVLEDFARDSSFPVRIAPNESRLGFSTTFLVAASRCEGDAIAFCDQDDVWLEHKLERCRDALAGSEVLLAMHASRVVDEALAPTGLIYPRYGSDAVVPRLGGDPWAAVRGMSMVFDADLIRVGDWQARPRSHYVDGPLHHDEWIYLLARALGRIALIGEPLALYRQHGANVAGAAGGLRRRLHEATTTGWTYYEKRRDQALDVTALFRELAEETADPGVRDRFTEAAEHHAELAKQLDPRLAVYEPGVGARERAARLARLARSGAYARRGFGPAAFARDALMIALRRHG
jgi:glycosyltransferase involved in cell wall biosynthesis